MLSYTVNHLVAPDISLVLAFEDPDPPSLKEKANLLFPVPVHYLH